MAIGPLSRGGQTGVDGSKAAMIETRYDPEADVLHVRFGPADAHYDSAQDVAPGVYVEFDTQGRPMAVEITSVRWISEGRPGARDDVPAERPAAE